MYKRLPEMQARLSLLCGVSILTSGLVNLVVFVLPASFVLSVVRKDGLIRFALSLWLLMV